MPESNQPTPGPGGSNSSSQSTTGWVQAVEPAFDLAAAPTQTQQPRSTPGPHQPERPTVQNISEPAHDQSGVVASALPCIPGLRIDEMIGRGGMGRVYRALHIEINKVVALKIITTAGRDAELTRGRFEREVQALARIEHPNIVPIYHAGDWHGFPYFTMKFVPGGPLSHHLSRFVGNPTAAATLMIKMAKAVQALHDAGVVHRDLKPLNILLAENDEPLVADFGLAKWLGETSSDLTVTHVPLGTRQYMAPEQTLGTHSSYSEACDIWALGVTLYELLSGVRPFPDDGSSDLYDRIRTADPPPLPDTVPPGLAAIVARCLAKQPEDRYPTAAAVAADLQAWLEGTLVPPAPPSNPTRRTPTGVLALGVLAVIGLIALPAWVMPWDPPPPKSIAERLNNGEIVTLIDEKGLPTVPAIPVLPGSVLTTDKDGYCLINALTIQYIDLIDEPIPLPAMIEGEVAIVAAKPDIGFGGLYFGGQKVQFPHEFVHVAWQVGITPTDHRVDGDHLFLIDRGLYQLMLVGSAQRRHFSFAFDTRHKFTTRYPRDVGVTIPHRWHRISVVIRERGIEPSVEGEKLASVDLTKKLLTGWEKFDLPLERAPVPLGNGIGIFGIDAEVTFRNLRVSTIQPR